MLSHGFITTFANTESTANIQSAKVVLKKSSDVTILKAQKPPHEGRGTRLWTEWQHIYKLQPPFRELLEKKAVDAEFLVC